jgi:hypothetical protein
VPHVASRERCAGPHVVHDDQCVALLVVHDDRRAALDPVSYWALLERWVLQRLVLERLVMAVPEPQHLTLLARWSAGPRRRLVREVKTPPRREISFSLMLETSKMDTLSPPGSHQRLLKMNAR